MNANCNLNKYHDMCHHLYHRRYIWISLCCWDLSKYCSRLNLKHLRDWVQAEYILHSSSGCRFAFSFLCNPFTSPTCQGFIRIFNLRVSSNEREVKLLTFLPDCSWLFPNCLPDTILRRCSNYNWSYNKSTCRIHNTNSCVLVNVS